MTSYGTNLTNTRDKEELEEKVMVLFATSTERNMREMPHNCGASLSEQPMVLVHTYHSKAHTP